MSPTLNPLVMFKSQYNNKTSQRFDKKGGVELKSVVQVCDLPRSITAVKVVCHCAVLLFQIGNSLPFTTVSPSDRWSYLDESCRL